METLIGNPATFVSELVWTVINFFLLFFLLKRFLFTPVIRFTEERKSRMDAKLAVEQDAKARASENDEKLAAEKEKAREEARCILSEAEESREKHHAAAVAEMKAKGYNYATTEEELAAARLPVLGLMSDDNLPIAQERGDLFRHMTARALDLLSQAAGDKGFAMMIEGSCIDDWLHGNDIGKAMEELLDFDRTLGDVLQWAAADGHTLVVVTADHSTGCLTLQDGDLAEGRIGVAFGSESHNGIAVPIYAWGPGSQFFGGIKENSEWGQLIASFIK